VGLAKGVGLVKLADGVTVVVLVTLVARASPEQWVIQRDPNQVGQWMGQVSYQD
jgi:hypothetical protein